MASLEHWWRFMPDRFAARPGVAVPEIPFDPGRSQRFAMTGGFCSFSSASAPVSAPAHGFHGFGAGMTYPVPGGDRDVLLAGAVGTLTSGFGRFRGLDGTYTCIGTLSREAGFRGSIMLRVCDPMGRLAGGEHPGPMRRGYALEPGVTYIVFRGQKKSAAEKTGFLFGPGGDIAGLRVHQELRLISIDSACNAEGRPRSSWNVGPVIGEMDARIKFNLTNPGAPGTNDAPIPFQSANSFRFFDGRGGAIGTLDSDGGEGRTFRLQLPESPRQNALRFGAFLPLTRGSGCFEGVRGIMTDNSVVGIAPHAISTLYVLRLDDPHGRFRLRLRDAWQ